MGTVLLLFFKRPADSGAFELLYGGMLFALLAVWMLWERVYRKKWNEYRSRNWTRVEGQFDEGEVVTMRKGRSNTISGYEVWLGYEYQVDGEQSGLFRLSEIGKDEADFALSSLANKRVVVRVDPDKSSRSFVSEDDLKNIYANRL